MRKRKTVISLVFLVCLWGPVCAQQTIKDFYLSNYKEDGSRDWEMKGDEAVVFDKHVDIEQMEAVYHNDEETVNIKSKRAQLNKENMDVALEEDVQVQGKAGIKLETESLEWKRDAHQIETNDWVKASNDGMQIDAQGLSGDTELKKVDFQKEVTVTLPEEESDEYTIITCDGPLEIEYEGGGAIFYNNVVVENKTGKLFADKATVIFDPETKQIDRVVSEGNVRILQDDNATFAQKATYIASTKKIVLEGRPRLIYVPEKDQHIE